jgi:tetratricopeptide (TPR) repeat protein
MSKEHLAMPADVSPAVRPTVPPRRTALLGLLALAGVGGLGGCASWRESFGHWRASLGQPALPAEQQRELDRLYALGARALLRDDVDAAIVAWRAHVALAPLHQARARQLRGYLTLLDREAARRFARQAAARERSGAFSATDRLHVALFPLQNQGPAGAVTSGVAFNRALMAMITTDLSRVPGVTVLEREKVDRLLDELKLAASGLVEPATLAAPARLLGAGTVIAGAVYNEPGPQGPGSGAYRINSAVTDVARGRVLGVQEARGRQAEFFTMQKEVVYAILESLDIRDLPPAVRRIHTRSWEAYARFAAGLQLLADNRLADARQAFAQALAIDPEFLLAEEAALSVPERLASLDEIKASVRGVS